MVMANDMSRWVPSAAYISDPVAFQYGTFFISDISSGVVGHWFVDRCNPGSLAVETGLAFSRLKHKTIMSMYAFWDSEMVCSMWYHAAFRHGITFNFQPHALPEYLNTNFQSVKTLIFTPTIIISQPSIIMLSPYSNMSFFDDPSDIEM